MSVEFVIEVSLFQMSELISRLSDWSSLSSPLAPLTETQQLVISQLGEEARQRPRPPHIQTRETSSEVSRGREEESQDTGQASRELWPAFRELEEGSVSLASQQQFLQWLHGVEESLVAEQSLPYQRFIDQLSKQLQSVQSLSERAGDSLQLLGTLDSQVILNSHWSILLNSLLIGQYCLLVSQFSQYSLLICQVDVEPDCQQSLHLKFNRHSADSNSYRSYVSPLRNQSDQTEATLKIRSLPLIGQFS